MIPIARPFIGQEEKDAVLKVLDSGMMAQGPKVRELEEKFAKFCGSKHAIAVSSGTAALHTALHVAGIKPGDEVITTPFTFISTANTILIQNAKPVFADIKEDTFNIDPEEIKKKITDKTRAIIAVDFYGQPCDYSKINKLAENNNLIVIEDSCQAINAEFNGKKAGIFGSAGTFSFYANKNITSGEGGMIVTDSGEYAENAKLFRQNGRSKATNYEYTDFGYNYRMTDIQAAILLEQLKKVDEITNRRIGNANYLTGNLSAIEGIEAPFIKKNTKHAFHQYTIKVTGSKFSRDGLQRYLKKNGVNTVVSCPKALHMYNHFKKLGYKEGDFPVAERLSRQILSLPVHPFLTKEDLDIIVKAIKDFA